MGKAFSSLAPAMDCNVRGIGEKFEWQQVLETLEEEPPVSAADNP